MSGSLIVDPPLAFVLASCCLSSSEVEEAVHEPHFLFTVLGMLQLSKYLGGTDRSVLYYYLL